MVYEDEKRREMARSILPSTHRREARRERKATNRHARRAARSYLKRGDEDADARLADVDGRRRREIEYGVAWRRGGDKVAPFVRWATAVTRGMCSRSRAVWLRAVLPAGLVGAHAVSHLPDTVAQPPVVGSPSDGHAERRTRLRGLVLDGAARRALALALRRAHVPAILVNDRVRRPGDSVETGERAGPAAPRVPTVPAEVDDLLARLYAAAGAPRFVRAATRVRERILDADGTLRHTDERIVAYEHNPAHHAEWLAALDRFLAAHR